MWSGPRNVSTALMRSFGSRPEVVVCDEPLYAHYLEATGSDHPVAAEIIAKHERDWRAVADWLTGPLPEGKSVFYQKHMAHHLLPQIGRDWLQPLTHAFLIREPRAMLASLARILPSPGLDDTGLPQQVQLFEELQAAGSAPPPVVDSRDLLLDPEGVLQRLCASLGLEFTPAMLTWEPGLRPTDGCWAQHWYGNALRSTGFQPFSESTSSLPAHLEPLLAPCQELYAKLHEHRIE